MSQRVLIVVMKELFKFTCHFLHPQFQSLHIFYNDRFLLYFRDLSFLVFFYLKIPQVKLLYFLGNWVYQLFKKLFQSLLGKLYRQINTPALLNWRYPHSKSISSYVIQRYETVRMKKLLRNEISDYTFASVEKLDDSFFSNIKIRPYAKIYKIWRQIRH